LRIGFTPGEKFCYSGEGYYYLQSVVTQLTGRVNPDECARYEAGFEVCATDIDPWMRRNLLKPFDMGMSGYVWRPEYGAHAARPHDEQGRPGRKRRPTACDAARYASAGGLHTTASDYAKFLIEVVDPRPGDAARLRAESLREMVRPQVRLDPAEKVDGADAWALGWGVQERSSGDVLIHSGGQSGFRSLAVASIARKAGFIILTNGENGGRVIGAPPLVEILDPLVGG
jgi:CubicO group peptidase (beta-lactamase class C family)